MAVNRLKLSAVNGVLWNFAELSLRRGSGALTTLILAWFLTPEDFGLVAMMAVFIALANVIVTGGLGQALIRKANPTNLEFETAFIANIFFAFLVYVSLFLTAPLIASFYEESGLTDMVRVSALTVFFNAGIVVQKSILSRQLDFKLQLQVSLPAAVLSGIVAIVLAYLGYGVWSLIIQTLVFSLFSLLLYWRLNLWRPDFRFSWPVFKQLNSFGGYLLLNQITTVPYKHMYVIVIAKIFSAPVAGLYFFAEKIRDLVISQLVDAIQTVTYPALAKVQEDPIRLKNGYRQVIAVMTFTLFPVLIFLAAMVEGAFQIFLPEQWWAASSYLQLMCISALLYPLNAINMNILKVCGKTNLIFYLGLFKKVTGISIFIVSIQYGIVGILLGQVLNSVIAYLPNSFYSNKLIGYRVSEQLADFSPALILASVVGIIVWYSQMLLNWPELVELLVLAGVGGSIYLVVSWAINLRGLALGVDLIKSRMNKKRNIELSESKKGSSIIN